MHDISGQRTHLDYLGFKPALDRKYLVPQQSVSRNRTSFCIKMLDSARKKLFKHGFTMLFFFIITLSELLAHKKADPLPMFTLRSARIVFGRLEVQPPPTSKVKIYLHWVCLYIMTTEAVIEPLLPGQPNTLSNLAF